MDPEYEGNDEFLAHIPLPAQPLGLVRLLFRAISRLGYQTRDWAMLLVVEVFPTGSQWPVPAFLNRLILTALLMILEEPSLIWCQVLQVPLIVSFALNIGNPCL